MTDSPFPTPDPQALARQFEAFAERGRRIHEGFLERQGKGEAVNSFEPGAVAKAFSEWNAHVAADPVRAGEAAAAYWGNMTKLSETMARRNAGEEVEPVVEPEPGDRRFRDPAWSEDAASDCLKQAYLIWSKYMYTLVDGTEGMDPHSKDLVSFYTHRFVESMSPSNHATTNPQVMQKARETGGQSLVDGFSNMMADLERGQGQLNITMTDPDAFEVGRNLAITEGAVVFENDLIQLIQYAPSTETVYKRPILIVPPWVNKYYVLDLTPEKSLVKWLVDQGYTVFLISWVNPTRELAHKTFEDYMTEGPLKALDVVGEVTGQKKVNVAGYCIGGTLSASMLAYLAAKGDERVKSATLIACMTDFEDAGEISVFIDDEQLATLRKTVEARGYHMGEEMAQVFTLMRADDLIWSHVVNRYMLGNELGAFDLVYWFQDGTRLPAQMIAGYLEDFYHHNLLAKPGGLTMGGVGLDLSRIETPMYFLSTDEDHISPWKSTYSGSKLFAGPSEFVLAGSGHNAGVVNPPTKVKYGYRTNKARPKTAEVWLEGAEQHEGSWWPHWESWLAGHSGKNKHKPRAVGSKAHPAIEPAPGRYVKVR